MEKEMRQGVRKYVDLLKDASNITEERYAEVIGATESEDPKTRRAAYYLLGNIMNFDLLDNDRDTFLEGFDAVLRTSWDEEPEIRHTGIVILSKLMKPRLLGQEEDLYMKGIDHLMRASCEPDPIVATRAKEAIELRKAQLEKIT